MQTIVLKYALNPTTSQVDTLSSHIGAVRYAYNWSIATVAANWEAVRQDLAIPYMNISAYGLRKELNRVKDEVAPWWSENSKEAFATGTANAAIAFKNWFKSRKGSRSGKSGFPKFKSRNHDTQTGIMFTTGTRRLEPDNRHFTLPTIGAVQLHEKAKTLRWLLQQGGVIANVTVRKDGTRWFLIVNIKTEDSLVLQYFAGKQGKKARKSSVGIDVGLKVFLATSDGAFIENPVFQRKALAKIRKANKRLARRRKLNNRTGETASARWDKAHQQLVRTHEKIRNQRTDFLHKISKQLVDDYQLIGVEDLHVAGMVKNKHLSRSIADASWGEFRRQLTYKSVWYGNELQVIPRFYPSSKMCSTCETVKATLSLSERIFSCDTCGLTIDRDVNAAMNIRKKAVAQSCGETLNERGEESSGLVSTTGETILSETFRDNRLKS